MNGKKKEGLEWRCCVGQGQFGGRVRDGRVREEEARRLEEWNK